MLAWVLSYLWKLGGVAILSAVQLAPSAFLASAAGTSDKIHILLPERLNNISIPNVDVVLTLWSQKHNAPPPLAPASSSQKAWVLPRLLVIAQNLLHSAPDTAICARLLVTLTSEAGARLNAGPIYN